MSEVIHADIFFFITAIAVVVVGGFLSVFLYHAIHIAKDVRHVAVKLRRASQSAERDFDDFRYNLRTEGTKIKTIADFLLAFLRRATETPPQKKPRPRAPVVEGE